jgi:ParB family chromosome partitioning protein
MARKNLIGISDHLPDEDTGPQLRDYRPIAGFVPPARGPVSGITKSLGAITEKVERAEAIERQLAEGEIVVEIDPVLIDSSFVKDRLAIEPADLHSLVEQMRDHGQQVPILVRPHPEDRGRFQLAYGHRRVAASRILERKVKAVVRNLTDEQLVVSQGQENNSRADLSYIERSLFAARLEEGGFSREVIMAALSVDKTNVSRMIALVRQVPADIIVSNLERGGSAVAYE